MSGSDSISLVGSVTVTSPKRCITIGLSQVITEIQGKSTETTIPHATNAGTAVDVSLPLSTGVTEALCLVFSCDAPIVVLLTSSDATHPGPMAIGIKGFSMLTMSPGEGIISITAYNVDPDNDASLEMAVISLATSVDQPGYWFPPSP